MDACARSGANNETVQNITNERNAATLLEQFAFLLNLLKPQAVEPAPDDFERTQPVYFDRREVGDA
ncbi:hypothetical protein [Methylibium sp.]|uniref:hypothetical protein n=1 Tax=Methylibium sp. TaxID=2067992 RepID=UPI0025F6D656|nr:hypothetical protein [Methylibium sp.]